MPRLAPPSLVRLVPSLSSARPPPESVTPRSSASASISHSSQSCRLRRVPLMPCLDEFCLFNGHFWEHTLLAAGLEPSNVLLSLSSRYHTAIRFVALVSGMCGIGLSFGEAVDVFGLHFDSRFTLSSRSWLKVRFKCVGFGGRVCG